MKRVLVLVLFIIPFFCLANKQEKEDNNNDFAFRLFKDISEHDNSENILVSPFSASIALSMAINGAEGETNEQIKSVLGCEDISTTSMNTNNRRLIKTLASLDESVDLEVVNSLWINHEFEVKPAFIKTLNHRYGAKVSTLNFSDYSSVAHINKWCNKATKGRIPEIIDDINSSMALYILNALYFKGKWMNPFNPEMTTKKSFTSSKGVSSHVDMMMLESKMQYYENAVFQMLELEYGNGSYVMDIILPKEDMYIADVLEQLNDRIWDTWISELSKTKVDLQLPKFSIDYDVDLVESLKALGMRLPFHYDADFSKISNESPLFIDVLKQKTFIEVNESGTEAAAVTAIGIATTSFNPEPPKSFHVNRPFIFILREKTTDTILFIGEINSL